MRWIPPTGAFAVGGAVGALVDVGFGLSRGAAPTVSAGVGRVVWALGLALAAGLAADGLLAVGRAVAPRLPRAAPHVAWALIGAAVAELGAGSVFERQADVALEGAYAPWIRVGFLLLAAGGTALGRALLVWLARRHVAWAAAGTALALGGFVANQLVYPDDYRDPHAAVVAALGVLLGTIVEPRLERLRGAWPGRIAAVAVACSLFAVVVPPPNAVRVALFRTPGAAAPWLFARAVWRLPRSGATPEPGVDTAWLAPRGAVAPYAPSEPLVPRERGPVVVLITIDALRADVIEDAERRAAWPTLDRLVREGVLFANARAPGSQTSVSLAALFTGRTFSMLRWQHAGEGRARFHYPAVDPAPRFPALLSEAGVDTFKVASLLFLRNDFGIASGFQEDVVVARGRQHARAAEVVRPLVARLAEHDQRPLFAFAHLTEPHAPYDRGAAREGAPFDRYLSEIAVADEHLGRLVRALEAPHLRGRVVLIVSADHGEAFGEHGTTEHTKTLYDELLRVPLVVWGEGVVPRRIDTPVTLIDVGPTVLDLFGQPWSASTVGESLVPLLAGRDVPLVRPIVAEGRLRRTMLVGDLKVHVDLRQKTVEAYDVALDPRELVDLSEREPERVARAVATLEAFFDAHVEPGYEPPYKP